jgi:hypothetical protein
MRYLQAAVEHNVIWKFMKTFAIEYKLSASDYDSTALRWTFIAFLWGVFVSISFLQRKLDPTALGFCVAYTAAQLYFRQSGKSSNYPLGITTLEFGNENLIYRNETSVIWHIPYTRLDKIQVSQHGSGGFLSPVIKEILILTNDNDSYSLMGTLPDIEIEKIQREIEIAKCKSI